MNNATLVWLDFLSASLWFILATVGIVLRVRRLIRLHQIRLREPVSPIDAEYLASVKRSTYLRLGVKVVFLIGSLVALFQIPLTFWAWRAAVVLMLALMILETVGVDRIRARLARMGGMEES